MEPTAEMVLGSIRQAIARLADSGTPTTIYLHAGSKLRQMGEQDNIDGRHMVKYWIDPKYSRDLLFRISGYFVVCRSRTFLWRKPRMQTVADREIGVWGEYDNRAGILPYTLYASRIPYTLVKMRGYGICSVEVDLHNPPVIGSAGFADFCDADCRERIVQQGLGFREMLCPILHRVHNAQQAGEPLWLVVGHEWSQGIPLWPVYDNAPQQLPVFEDCSDVVGTPSALNYLKGLLGRGSERCVIDQRGLYESRGYTVAETADPRVSFHTIRWWADSATGSSTCFLGVNVQTLW